MSYHPTDIGFQVSKYPEAAKKTLLDTYKQSGANAKDAAELVGVSERAFHRYVIKLGLARRVALIRAQARREGWLKSDLWPKKEESAHE